MISFVRYFRRKLKAHHVDAYSAQAAFFLLFSFFPLLLLVFSSVKFFSISTEAFLNFINMLLPSFLEQWVLEILSDMLTHESNGVTWISAFALVWAASKCVFYIIGGLNTILESKERRKFWHIRLLSILYTFIFVLAITSTIILMVFGEKVAERLYAIIPSLPKYILSIITARYFVTFLLLLLFFLCLYKALPAKKFSIQEILPGAVLASVGWIVFSALFALYVQRFANYSNVYGGLASIVVFMLWLYICMQILFWGAEINLLIKRLNSSKVY